MIAVRVWSPDASVPGGLVDIAGSDRRIGILDPAASEDGKSIGYRVGGVGWYRKIFTLSPRPDAKEETRYFLRFDGIYMNCDIWVNEQLLMTHPYGYTTFEVEITRVVTSGDNIIAIRVNSYGANSRWYAGAGIFRHTWLLVTPATRIALWGVGVLTPTVSKELAIAEVTTTIETRVPQGDNVTLNITIISPHGHTVELPRQEVHVAYQGLNVTQSITIPQPALWSPDHPESYEVIVSISGEAGEDQVREVFGFRSFRCVLLEEPTAIVFVAGSKKSCCSPWLHVHCFYFASDSRLNLGLC